MRCCQWCAFSLGHLIERERNEEKNVSTRLKIREEENCDEKMKLWTCVCFPPSVNCDVCNKAFFVLPRESQFSASIPTTSLHMPTIIYSFFTLLSALGALLNDNGHLLWWCESRGHHTWLRLHYIYWRFPCHSESILGSELNDEHDTRSLDWHLLRICCVWDCHALRRHKLGARHILSTSGTIIKQSVNETHRRLTLRLTISFFVWMNLIACELTPLLPRWHAHVRWRMENFLNFRSDVFIHISHIIIENIIHIHIWAKLLFPLGIIDWMENFSSRTRYQPGKRAAMASDERLERGKTVCQTRVNYHQVDEWVALIVVVWNSRSTRCSFPPRSLQNLPSRQRGNLIFGSNHRQHTAGRVEHAKKRTRARVEMESKQRKRFHSSCMLLGTCWHRFSASLISESRHTPIIKHRESLQFFS